jgi:hypothetical protein
VNTVMWGAGVSPGRYLLYTRIIIIYDKPPNGWAPRSPYREVYHVPIAIPARTVVYTQRGDAPCQPVSRPRGELSSGLKWGAVGNWRLVTGSLKGWLAWDDRQLAAHLLLSV